jgi:hypothetical protein
MKMAPPDLSLSPARASLPLIELLHRRLHRARRQLAPSSSTTIARPSSNSLGTWWGIGGNAVAFSLYLAQTTGAVHQFGNRLAGTRRSQGELHFLAHPQHWTTLVSGISGSFSGESVSPNPLAGLQQKNIYGSGAESYQTLVIHPRTAAVRSSILSWSTPRSSSRHFCIDDKIL